eukprot:scaffold14652_cov30-Prasinocladus_malaysianus.AAC.3
MKFHETEQTKMKWNGMEFSDLKQDDTKRNKMKRIEMAHLHRKGTFKGINTSEFRSGGLRHRDNSPSLQ